MTGVQTCALPILDHAGRLDDLAPAVRAELALTLATQYDHIQDESVLDRALREARTALARTPPDDDAGLDRLGVLGLVLAQTAETRRDPDALREAVGLLRPAIGAAGRDHPYILRAALAMLRVLTQRGAWNTGVSATTEVGRELRPLLDLVPDDNPGRPFLLLSVLGAEMNGLVQLGDFGGAREKREAIDRALRDLPEGEPLRDSYRLVTAANLVLERMVAQDPALDRAVAR
mgnify:CR=1 FL=1